MSSLDVGKLYSAYINNPSKQVNLGWTVVSIFYVIAVFLGLAFIGLSLLIMCTNESLNSGESTKRNILILAYVGLGLMVFGLWSTINNFYVVVAKINSNIRTSGDCSLFVPDTAIDAARLLISNSTLDSTISDAVESRRNASLNIQPAYGTSIYDNTSSLASLLPTPVSPPKISNDKALAVADKLKLRISEGRGSDTDKEALALIESLNSMT